MHLQKTKGQGESWWKHPYTRARSQTAFVSWKTFKISDPQACFPRKQLISWACVSLWWSVWSKAMDCNPMHTVLGMSFIEHTDLTSCIGLHCWLPVRTEWNLGLTWPSWVSFSCTPPTDLCRSLLALDKSCHLLSALKCSRRKSKTDTAVLAFCHPLAHRSDQVWHIPIKRWERPKSISMFGTPPEGFR